MKEEMVGWENKPLFKERHTKTVGYDLTPEEKVLYDEVTRYVRTKRKEAKAKKNVNVELTLMVMQRRLTSSIFAITRTLENRLAALNEILRILRDPIRTEAEKKRLLKYPSDPNDPRNIAEYEDLSEEERERVDQRIFRQVLTADPAKVEEERDEVERLSRLAGSLRNHNEAKFTELLAVLDASDVIRSEDEKLLIFTEHRDTLQNLADRLTKKGSEEIPSKMGIPMRRDDEVARIAMEVAMRLERSRGWNPVDVSLDGEHYDIRSESPNGEKRYIEVKGRAQTGAIVLTGPELDKLRQLADRAWLYIVTFCKGESPRIRTIQDPIPKLNPEMLYRQVQFLIEESDWARQGEEVAQVGEGE